MNTRSIHMTDVKSALRNPFGMALVVYFLMIASLVVTGEPQSIRMCG